MIRRTFVRTVFLTATFAGVLPLPGLRASVGRADEPKLPAAFDVVDSGHEDRFVARIRVDLSGHIAIERTDPSRRRWFEDIVDDVNRQETIILPAPPPSSAPRFAMYGFPIARGDPRFLSAMRVYLRDYHSLELR